METALADDPDLARRYELVREELAQTIHLDGTWGAPAARAMHALFAKIDAEPQRAHAGASLKSRRTHPGAFRRAVRRGRSPGRRWAAPLAIALQAGFIAGILIKQHNPGYQTASVSADVPPEGSFALVRFQPCPPPPTSQAFLETNKLSIWAVHPRADCTACASRRPKLRSQNSTAS